jgi:hypothetical protein
MRREPRRDPAEVLRDGEAIDRAIVRAQREVVLRHRKLGLPLVIWRDGKVVEAPADTFDLPPDDEPEPRMEGR